MGLRFIATKDLDEQELQELREFVHLEESEVPTNAAETFEHMQLEDNS